MSYVACEIRNVLSQVEFEVIDLRYVQAGHFDVMLEQLDSTAEEICVVCKKM